MDHVQVLYWIVGAGAGLLAIGNTVIMWLVMGHRSAITEGEREAQWVTWDELHKWCGQRHQDNNTALEARFRGIENQLSDIKRHMEQVDTLTKSVAEIHGYLKALAERKDPPS